MSNLSHIPVSSYNLGRLSLVIPKELQPQIKEFYYKWDSRNQEKTKFNLGYPISLYEYPFCNNYKQQEQWINAIKSIKQKYKGEIILEWNLNNLFSRNAYFICFREWRGENCFLVMIQEEKCILHYSNKVKCLPNDIPQKDDHTNSIIKNIYNFLYVI